MLLNPFSPVLTDTLNQACRLLSQGNLVVMPTETVYGLAGDAQSDQAVALIYATKGRPQFNPLIIHVDSLEKAQQIAIFSDLALKIACHFWPGPLTLILPRQPLSKISLLASAGLDTIALRIPAHPIAQALLKAYNRPLAAPSANRSNHISPTCTTDVRRSLGEKTPFVLEGGNCAVGLESTILDLSESTPHILRPGGISPDDLEFFVGKLTLEKGAELPRMVKGPLKSPGLLKRHYAPDRPLRLNAANSLPGEAFLAFGPAAPGSTASSTTSSGADDAFTKNGITFNLSPSGCVQEAAANLFRYLHACDQAPFNAIAVAPIPHKGLGIAINDRLQRAAASKK